MSSVICRRFYTATTKYGPRIFLVLVELSHKANTELQNSVSCAPQPISRNLNGTLRCCQATAGRLARGWPVCNVNCDGPGVLQQSEIRVIRSNPGTPISRLADCLTPIGRLAFPGDITRNSGRLLCEGLLTNEIDLHANRGPEDFAGFEFRLAH